jgi:AraC family transcriptional regulator of adaptative response / DNA-3-methyladenine glycosylase II
MLLEHRTALIDGAGGAVRTAGARAFAVESASSGRAGGAEVVRLGIQHILDGGLDDDNGEHLAARLGISHRRLRHLFQTYAGITPDQLARSSRAHFARRMLGDTDLPVTDIAFASGFGSLRQFNRIIHATFGTTPMALRARRRRDDSLVDAGGLVVCLGSSTGPVWEAMLAHLRTHAIAGVESVDRDAYRRTIVVDGECGGLEVRRSRSSEVLMRAHLLGWRDLLDIVQKARRIFTLDVDLEGADRGPRAGRGLRIPGTWEPFEVGIRAIIGRERSADDANALASCVAEAYGQSVQGFSAWGLTRTFPTAQALAHAELDGIGLTAGETIAVGMFAESVMRGDVRLDQRVPLDQFIESLLAIPGVDMTTAHYLALRIGVTVPDRWVAQGGLRQYLGQRRSQTTRLDNSDMQTDKRKSPFPISTS